MSVSAAGAVPAQTGQTNEAARASTGKAAAADAVDTFLDSWHAVVSSCLSLVDSREDAEDCASAAFVALLERHQPPASSEAFLVAVARRRAVDETRRKAWQRHKVERLRAAVHPEGSDLSDGVVNRDEARWLAARVLPTLPAKTRLVIEAVAYGKSVAVTAEELSITVRAAESHLLRARRILRQAVVEHLANAVQAGDEMRSGSPSAG